MAIFLKHKNGAENLSTGITIFSATGKRSPCAGRFGFNGALSVPEKRMLDRNGVCFTLRAVFCRLRAEFIRAYGEEKSSGSES